MWVNSQPSWPMMLISNFTVGRSQLQLLQNLSPPNHSPAPFGPFSPFRICGKRGFPPTKGVPSLQGSLGRYILQHWQARRPHRPRWRKLHHRAAGGAPLAPARTARQAPYRAPRRDGAPQTRHHAGGARGRLALATLPEDLVPGLP